jgi:alkenylglycerophosphocholine hydrolase
MMTNRSVAFLHAWMAGVSVLGVAVLPIRHHFPLWFFLTTQVLPTISAVVLTAVGPTEEPPRYRWGMVAALATSFAAGVAMGLDFLAGVFVFFVANVAYLTAFTTQTKPLQRILPVIIYGSVGCLIVWLAYPKIPLREVIPIVVYGVSITAVASQSVVRYLVTRRTLAMLAAIGASLLFVSDSSIGLDKYGYSFPGCYPFIMVTYFLGQWLLAMSVVGTPWKR